MTVRKHEAQPRVRSPLARYVADLERFPLLSAEEERRLACAYRESRDDRIAHRLVTANLRFVIKLAREHRALGVALPDLVQEGNIGLMKAIERFDPDKGFRLVSYAAWWIRAAMLDFILRTWSLVRVGTTQAQRRLFFSLARIQREVERAGAGAGLEDGADAGSVAERADVKPSELDEMTVRLGSRDVSLDAPYGDGGATFHELLPDGGPQQESLLSRAQEEELMRVRVSGALSRLRRREREIVERRLMNESPESLTALGAALALSSQRVSQIEVRARKKLRVELEAVLAELDWGAEVPRPGARRGRRILGRKVEHLPERAPRLDAAGVAQGAPTPPAPTPPPGVRAA